MDFETVLLLSLLTGITFCRVTLDEGGRRKEGGEREREEGEGEREGGERERKE